MPYVFTGYDDDISHLILQCTVGYPGGGLPVHDHDLLMTNGECGEIIRFRVLQQNPQYKQK
jgi:hypothetical protein